MRVARAMLRAIGRELPLAVAALLLGAATAVGVAWSFRDLGESASVETKWVAPSGARWLSRVWLGETRDACDVGWGGPSVWTGEPRVGEEAGPWLAGALPHAAWRSMVRGSARLMPAGGWWSLQAYGWPRRCVAGGHLSVGSRRVNLGWWEPPWIKRWGPFPALAIWSGLAVDAALMAAPWWLLLVGVGWARGLRRRRKGRCPRCGYSVRGSPGRGGGGGVCPECGLGAAVAP